jgi:hypothetical protein
MNQPKRPALLSGNDMAEILSRILSRKVRRKPPVQRLAMANEGWKVERGTQFAQRLVAERPAVQRT